MHTQFENTGFARVYLWTVKAKYTMGILYLTFTLFYLFFGLFSAGPAITLNLFTALQMMFAGFFIGIAQQAIAPKEKLTKARCTLWVATGTLIAIAFSLVFGWFAAFPTWCAIAFFAVLVIGMFALLLGEFISLRRETRTLNRRLEKFQSQGVRQEATPQPHYATPESFGLSAREQDVLHLMLAGKPRHEIADTLQLSLGTVNTYCTRIHKKTHATNLPELFLLFGAPEPPQEQGKSMPPS